MNRSLYNVLENIPGIKYSYIRKFIFIAFLGIHLPLIGLVLAMFIYGSGLSIAQSFLMVLLFTLLATFFTIVVLRQLLEPIKEVVKGLKNFRDKGEIKPITTKYHDEVGELIHNVSLTLTKIVSLNEFKNNLNYLLFHDLRSPAARTLGYLGYLKSRISKDFHSEIEQLEKGMSDQLSLLNDVSVLSQANDLGDFKDKLVSINLETILRRVLRDFQTKAAEKNILLKSSIKRAVYIEGNEQLIEHVFLNLLSNAVKFSQKGGIIEVSDEISEDGIYSISFTDAGIGFDNDIASVLFTKFSKASRKGTAGESSTGLGLYLVKVILDKHEADIKASSCGTGKGARFQIFFPKTILKQLKEVSSNFI